MSLSQVSRPGPGQTLAIHPAASDKIALDFPTEDVTLSRDDNALIFTFNDGAVIRLDDFYADYHADSMPEFEVDGRLMSGTEFFNTLGADLMPGAGPEHEARNAHAVQADGDSSLMGGLDHLNGLNASTQEKSVAADGGLQFDSALAAGHGPADHGSGAGGPELPPPADVPFVRAVLYSLGDPGDSVSTPVFFGGNGVDPEPVSLYDFNESGFYALRYAVTVSVPEGWSDSWVDVNVASSRLHFSLTPEGATELQRLGLTDKNLVDLVHVTVTDRVSGGTFEYDVELVATNSQNFDSIEYDRQSVGHHLENIGEFHHGQHHGGVYSIISSSQNDEITLDDTVAGGSSIYASGSVDRAHMADDNNTITLNAGVVNTTSGVSTHVISANGALQVAGSVAVQGSGAENVIAMGNGSVDVYSKSGDGVSAADHGKNDISGGIMYITSSSGKGLAASNGGANDIATKDGAVTVRGTTSGPGSEVFGYGISASSSGSNSINADSGDVTVTGTTTSSGSHRLYGYGIFASASGNNNITTKSGDVTLTGNASDNKDVPSYGYTYGYGMAAEDASNNTIATDSGSVTVTGRNSSYCNWGAGSGMNAENASRNTITTNSGAVTVTGTSIGAGFTYGMESHDHGSNSIATKSGDVTVATTGSGYGYFADGSGMGTTSNDGSNTITTDSGSVTVIGTGSAFGNGMDGSYSGSSNTITTGSGAVTVTGIGTNGGSGTGNGMSAGASGSNSITTDSGNVTVSGTGTTVGRGMLAINGSNTITTNSGEVSVSGSSADSGYGMFAKSQGVNMIESTAGSPLTVTITASADVAEKAIAMWAEGGGSVNRITGHSQANGKDSVTLAAKDGHGIAMQTDNGGKNIITTGAGDDSVTIDGAVKSLNLKAGDGPGNEIDLGGGKNTLTLNGAVEAGSLKVSSEGGTYTLVLQAPDAESFVARYGDWITAIGADPFIADGLRGISFDGLNTADLPADFMTTFGGLLDVIHSTEGGTIIPPELINLLPVHDSDFSSASSSEETGAEHHTQDAQHAVAGHDGDALDAQHVAAGHDGDTQDAQHAAAGHDTSTQDALSAAHDGSVHMAGDDSQVAVSAASVQTDEAVLHADIPVPDDIAQPDFVGDQYVVDTAQPLFAFLSDPAAGAHLDTSAYEGDASLHNGYLGNGESVSGNAGVQGEIALTLGDESLDSLFAGTDQHLAENGEHGPWYVESGSDLHEVALTDMNEIIVQDGSDEHVSDTPVVTAEYAQLEHEVSSIPSVMDSNQEATDNAVREMTTY